MSRIGGFYSCREQNRGKPAGGWALTLPSAITQLSPDGACGSKSFVARSDGRSLSMQNPTPEPKTPEEDADAAAPPQSGEEAQEEAAREREEEGGYQ
jgi:hypothetical protein